MTHWRCPDHLLGAIGGIRRACTCSTREIDSRRWCTGGTKRTLKEMTSYAEQRVQFGHPLADFEITQRKLSRIASEIYASDSMLGSWHRS